MQSASRSYQVAIDLFHSKYTFLVRLALTMKQARSFDGLVEEDIDAK
jgi:hypothetical protein